MSKATSLIALLTRKAARLLDDRLTVMALGLAVGHFGLSSEQWGHVADIIVAIASGALYLIPDPKLKSQPPDVS